MSVWGKFTIEERKEYIKFLQVYGALSNLFLQKKGSLIPYLDSKFQETIFSRTFKCDNVDSNNTPHDVLAIIENNRIGIGLKTWMDSKPSFQKVMQLKSYQNSINIYRNDAHSLVYKISEIKNERLFFDYNRLGLSFDKNIYHYVTRDKGLFTINETAYPLVDLENLKVINISSSSITWTDGQKEYRYTFGDSQIHQKFDSSKYNSLILDKFEVKIIEDPFEFLMKAYFDIIENAKPAQQKTKEIFLPLYSYRSNEVEEKSGLNAWNAASKNKGSETLRPLNEIYIPIPKEFHKKHPDFFVKNIFELINERKKYKNEKENRPELRFRLKLPNGKNIPALITGDGLKNFQSGSKIEYDENGKLIGQSALGQWLLIDVLGLKERKLVTRDWLAQKQTDSVRLWRNNDDYNTINIDFAPFGSFEAFMNEENLDI